MARKKRSRSTQERDAVGEQAADLELDRRWDKLRESLFGAGDEPCARSFSKDPAFVEMLEQCLPALLEAPAPARGPLVGIVAQFAAEQTANSRLRTVIVAALTRLLEDSDEAIRWRAASALCDLDTPVKTAALPVLVDTLLHRAPQLSNEAAAAIAQIGAAAVPVLLEALRSPGEDWERPRVGLRQALSQIAESDVRAVGNALREDDCSLRRNVALALSQSDRGLEFLLHQAARDADVEVRRAALHALAAEPGRAQDALYGVPDASLVLTAALRDPDWVVRRDAAQTLGYVTSGDGSDARIEALLRAAADPSREVRWAVIDALRVGSSFEDFVSMLSHPDANVRAGAVAALPLQHYIEGNQNAAIVATQRLLGDPNERVRSWAAHSLCWQAERAEAEPDREQALEALASAPDTAAVIEAPFWTKSSPERATSGKRRWRRCGASAR
jgi:HEAT repeat protein